ncbi:MULTISPECIES: LysR family transcriptional regulator [Paraburkholderia]|uniref:LysR family transcriptional regulator n=1 Tax=Paraburkholderia TaxID=1822464 RepID=UPI0022571A33|nr:MULTISPECIES: LysR family transcriptional regulator [Paraburkholderia]MCX4163472.1 LysR family transcriptional regulator [Paraburkholderia megapolitana]MDN7158967.1 LysR family transcriptional regulator [Paraburkholderia sp. CHISQ3]MDQ6496014.1 LysR family transcriptional regulator [Paraburkholderia megapolitana]
MFDWENFRFFLAIAQAGSLSGAARALKVDHATVGRRLSALEEELQARLIDRLPRSCQLTALGRQVLTLATEMEVSAFAVERTVRAEQSPMTGTVTISVPPVLATNFFAKHLFEFRQLHPDIRLSMASQPQSVSLGRREADLAVRLFRPTEPGNVTRKLGRMPFALYASRHYEHVAKPESWEFIAYEAQLADMPHQKWLLAAAEDRKIVCEVSDITTQHVAARTGIGVAGLPTFIGDEDPTLQRLPFDGEAFFRDIWLVVHPDMRHSPLLRPVIEFFAEVVGRAFANDVVES